MRESALFIGLVLVWGSTWLAVKIGLDTAPPFWFATIRFIIAFVVLGAIILLRKPDYSLVKRNFGKILTAGFLAYGFCYATIYWGQRFISSGTAAVLFASIPFFVALFSVRMLPDEKSNSAKSDRDSHRFLRTCTNILRRHLLAWQQRSLGCRHDCGFLGSSRFHRCFHQAASPRSR